MSALLKRRIRFTAIACDELRAEARELATEKPTKRWESIVFRLPKIECDMQGYERQVLADMQIGLMALCESDSLDRGEALMNIRESR
jgi:hypothetical protein